MSRKEDLVLSHVSIENFKSIREADLELRPLTVLVGENSAGKSSLLQLVFLMSQVVRGRTRPDVISLNGAELNLGNFEDVLHSASSGGQIHLAMRSPLAVPFLRGFRFPSRRGEGDKPGTHKSYFEWNLSLGAHPSQLGAAQVLRMEVVDNERGARLVVTPNEEPTDIEDLFEYSRSFSHARTTPIGRGRFFTEKTDTAQFQGYLEDDKGMREDATSRFLPAVVVENGFPVEVFDFPDSRYLADRWVDMTIGRAMVATRARSKRDGSRMRRTIGDTHGTEERAQRTLVDLLFPMFRRWVNELYDEDQDISPVEPLDDKDVRLVLEMDIDIVRTLADLLGDPPRSRKILAPKRFAIVDVANAFQTLFHSSIHYLGPLREAPNPSYRPGQGGGVATLGIKGEFTVAALDTYGAQRILAPLPGGDVEETTLKRAVNLWVDELGLAQEIRTVDKGRVGLELELLDSQTGETRDLTNVGVGVSQALPVILMCLLAQPGELILLEQPELHLHPAPQQRLGDFLLGIIDAGRQVIVETHSEYLINRLRLRMAEDDRGEVHEKVQLLYAKRTDGETRFQEMQANRFGTFEDWPEGFFDQAPREAEAILRAAARKRRASRVRDVPVEGDRVPIYVDYQGQRIDGFFERTSRRIQIASWPLEGKTYASPSGAARAVVRALNPEVNPQRNGWNFWTVSKTDQPLASIRNRSLHHGV